MSSVSISSLLDDNNQTALDAGTLLVGRMAEAVADYLEVESEEEEEEEERDDGNKASEETGKESNANINTTSVEEESGNAPVSEQAIETEGRLVKKEEKVEQSQQSPVEGEVAVEEEVPVVETSIEANSQQNRNSGRLGVVENV